MTSNYVSNLGIKDWQPERLPDLTGKLFVITGGNSGIGAEAARVLGERGADLILACRSPQKAETARARLAKTIRGKVDLVTLDLSDLASIRDAAALVRTLAPKIDGLINNAGIMQTPEMKTRDGFELQFGTNHLGHFLWTSLLIDLVEAASGRVVQISSIAHRVGRINFGDLMFRSGYTPTKAYGQSKLANLMFALELDRRLAEAGSPASAIACHPGYSNTNLQSTGPTGFLHALYGPLNSLIAQPKERGAIPTLLAAAGVEAKRGAYYGPTGFLGMSGPVSDAHVASHALKKEDWKALWQASETLLDITFLPTPQA
ncbi:oxidoreductase [uncultured Cohaesibacter sp.]|uniref:oxidoreductase n=1 Tax=uncultured Cohaesibacter sp. TaxID=1002546 RepID=UPI00292F2326|nr:oxidoreductase [uncultured Cohaesibacter sp.]